MEPGRLASSPDLQVLAAWQQGYSGEGVLVAVLDNLFQTNHPNLSNSFYTVEQSNKCPGETFGWDFSTVAVGADFCRNGDSNPAINRAELSDLQEEWQDIFTLTDRNLVTKYASEVTVIQEALSCQNDCSEAEIASRLRNQFFLATIGEFHGTLVSGVIAAQPNEGTGLVGVAPNAKILPARISMLGARGPSAASTFEAIGYVISRGADIINMSFGLPDEIVANRIQTALVNNPRLIFVASAGNSGRPENAYPDRVFFPAALDGVVAVGATNLGGERAPYSNYGTDLDVVAPGGDLSFPNANPKVGGLLTTGGTFLTGLWGDIEAVDPSQMFLDPQGQWIWIDGTSFSAPAVAGVLALMMSVDSHEQLTREDFVEILQATAGYNRLQLSQGDRRRYEQLKDQGELPDDLAAEQYFFGDGLVDANAAVEAVRRRLE
ncbi:MAG: S8 family serine peptidase [Leptolyngbya sp. SIO1D8]|nr:S8 family serine peptidase [Leptolyngbya sp. SIO1D8]